jgi:putative hemolysin
LEPGSWYELGASAACLLLVALTAATEAVLAQITRQQLRKQAEGNPGALRSVERLLARPRAYGAAMTLLHTVGAVAFTTLIASILLRERVPAPLWVAFAISAPILLLLGHSLPRGLARRSVERTANGLTGFAVLATALASPLLVVYDAVTRFFLLIARRPTRPVAPEPMDEEELQAVLGPEYTSGDPIEEEEREMIDAILDLEDRTARDIMVPRLDIVAVPEELPLAEVVEVIRQAGHSRVPVYRGSIDTIVGVIYAKDLLRFIPADAPRVPLGELMRPIERALIVPESKAVDELLKEMRTRKHHLALVLDEYGGTAGILTIEDILEEIVGEIADEHDPARVPEVEEISDHELLVDARISAEEVSDWLGLHWSEDEEHPTLGGLVQRELGRLPEAGEELDIAGAHITVLSVEGHRLKRLRVEKRAAGGNGTGDANGHAADRAASATDAAK